MVTTHHVFLTRFNLPSEGSESLRRAQEGWLRDRVALFERYTVPSVRSQTVKSAAWLVYLDPESPEWLLDRIRPLAREGLLTPLLRSSVPSEDLRADIARAVQGATGDLLLTSNLDNDDGLAEDFVARLQGIPASGERTALYLTHGLIKAGNRLYLRHDRRNAFCSVLERMEAPETCWADWHNLLERSMRVQEIGGPPAWLQVIHCANVSNRVRGRIASPREFGADFGCLIDDVVEPSASTVLVERAVRAPLRFARESVRAFAKRVIMRVGGKDGLERARHMLTGRGLSR